MNPAINDVVAAYGQVTVHAISISIDKSGVSLPGGGHFQGIQRLPSEPGEPQLLVMTASAPPLEGFFVACEMAEDGLSGRAYSPVTMAWFPLDHAGGCQAVGHCLVAGLENHEDNQISEVQFWDFRRFPMRLIPMTIPRSGPQYVSTAGAVGLSSFGNGAALAVATYSAATVDFYTSEADPFTGSPFKYLFTWVGTHADKTGWIDQNFGAYQNVNLLTQTDGQLFMVGLHRAGNEDFMDLFSVNLEGDPPSAFKKLAKKHMFCTDGCNFDDGAGIFITSSKGFEVYAVNGDTGSDTIHANRFAAM
jgi:hypothetical protein